jgi:hypothetical protein
MGLQNLPDRAGASETARSERERALRLVAGIPDGAEVDVSLIRLPDEALVFPAIGANLTPIRSRDGVTTDFTSHARRLGFEGVSLHDLRVSPETALLDRGVPVYVVAERCGHDPATLLRYYPRRTKKADAAVANVIRNIDGGRSMRLDQIGTKALTVPALFAAKCLFFLVSILGNIAGRAVAFVQKTPSCPVMLGCRNVRK